MFEKATKQKLRFKSGVGLITTEDLWDLPLTNGSKASLDNVAKALHKEIKDSGEISFVDDSNAASTELNLKMDIVKHIIASKKATADANKKRVETMAQNKRIREIIANKQDEQLQGKSVEELERMIQE